jgi:hypothetical protein
MGRFFTFKAIFAFFSPQRCDEQLPEDAPYGCEMSSLALSFFGLSLLILGRCIFFKYNRPKMRFIFYLLPKSAPSFASPYYHFCLLDA